MTLRGGSLVMLGLLALGGCAGRETVANPARLGVDFSWNGVVACVAESPSLRISNAPAGTARYAVQLADLNVPGFAHGGGEVARPAGDVIQAGALAEGYRGPCPPGRHTYRFTVQAIDGQNRIVGTGAAEGAFPP